MARIETDPNYNSPTFSRATAPTDIFKKEDVQGLAAAMSTHNHDGAGHGVAVAFGTIPANAITSAMIAEGTITSADIANGAVTSFNAVYGSSPSPTTTSTSFVDLPDLTLSITCPQPCVLRVDLAGAFICTVGTGYYQIQLLVDGVAVSIGANSIIANASTSSFNHNHTFGYIGATVAAHTIKAQWLVASGTLQAYSTMRSLSVLEIRR